MNINIDYSNKLAVEEGMRIFNNIYTDAKDGITGLRKVIFSSTDTVKIKELASKVESLTMLDASEFVQDGVFGKQDFRVNYFVYKCLEEMYAKYKLRLKVNFAYRPYLMTCGGDTNGLIDATDFRGHALGCALDLPTLRNAQLYKISEADFIKLMASYNFVRPFLNPKIFKTPETWHFRWMGRVDV